MIKIPEFITKSEFLFHIYEKVVQFIPKVNWGTGTLTSTQKVQIAEKLASNYYIILVADGNRLSSFLISIMTLFATGQWGKYTHALMNCDYMDSVEDIDKFKFVEATASGVHYSTFDEVFSTATKVCLLRPSNVVDWTPVIDSLVKEVGLPYDDLFDLSTKNKLSCVEVVFDAFEESEFPRLKQDIKDHNTLTPQMFRETPDLVVEYEV